MLKPRKSYLSEITKLFKAHSVVAILGPRQCGKTTLARLYAQDFAGVTHLDLEDPTDLMRLQNPKLALQDIEGLVVIDEIQRVPDLFPVLRILVDRPANKTKFLVLGSASRDLIRQSSESLAGRIAYMELTPFSVSEVGGASVNKRWLRGGFPPSFLADDDSLSFDWRQNYISTFLERDIPNLGISIPATTLRRFWMMLSHYHGQTLNYSELGRSFGISDTTVKKYIDILSGTFMIRQLQPWFENISKRQVRSPKLYFRDTGIYHWFLGARSRDDLLSNPKLGSSWEGFAMEEIIHHYRAKSEEVFFWATQAKAELDLLIIKDGSRIGVEIKYTETPRITPSMRSALKDLKLSKLQIVFPGSDSFPLDEKVEARGLLSII